MVTPLPEPGAGDVLYVVDLSSYVLRAYHAVAPLSSPSGEPTHAVFGTVTMIERLLRERRPALLAIAMDSGRETFRHEMYPEYKANRPPAPEDLKVQFKRCEELVEAWGIAAFRQVGVEADDMIACLVDATRGQGLRVVIVGADKDLMQLVGDDVVLWDTMRQRVFGPPEVRERFGVRADQLRDYLALVGDTSDNVPGVPSVGPKTAADLLSQYETLEGVYANLDGIPRAKLREALRQHRQDALLSQKLVTLKRDCRVEFDETRLRSPVANWQSLERIYTELGFHKQLVGLRAAMARSADAPAATRLEVASPWPETRLVDGLAAWETFSAEVRDAPRVAISPVLGARAFPRATLAAVGVALAPDRAFLVPLRPDPCEGPSVQHLTPLLDEVGSRAVIHDLKQLALGLDCADHQTPPTAFDLLLASYLVNPETPHTLDALVSEHLGVELPSPARPRLFTEDARDSQTSLRDAAGAQAIACLRLYDPISRRLDAAGLRSLLMDVECPLAIELARMQRRGVLVDTERLGEIAGYCASEIRRLEQEAHRIAGREFNVHAPRQLETLLFDELHLKPLKRTKTARSTDAATLEALADEHPLPQVILDLRQIAKLKSTYIDALPALRDPETKRIHTTWEQAVAATGRLSSTEPNMQNIPVRTELGRSIRATFVAATGCQLVSADYSQIELRILAHLSEDPVLLEAFALGQDVHTRTAAEIFDVPATSVTTEQRRRAKAVNFGVIYGQGDSGLAKALGITRPEAARFIAAYFRRHAGVRRFMEAVLGDARAGETIQSILGRRRLLPDLRSGNRARRLAAERIAMNMPIQASAADVLKLAMLKLSEPVTPGSRLILTVHDELVFEVPDAEVAAAKERIAEIMTTVYPLKVPLVVSVGHGPNWNVAH